MQCLLAAQNIAENGNYFLLDSSIFRIIEMSGFYILIW
jgi:hypothetical protein